MSETVQKQNNFLTSNHKWVTPVLLALLVAIFVVSLIVGGRKPAGEGQAFAGTDDAAAQAAEKAGAKQWIKPIFEPNSGEVASGLFALQAALGAGIAGYALGRMSGRKKAQEEMDAARLPDAMPPAVATSHGAVEPAADKAADARAADPAADRTAR
ncbi:energy-coupling factor ABC transporter substrate-binding protein [Acidipropionibacterium jensenii]|uniref:Energy-coupling factor ABC transporter substrate-binding protein n=1 Tax=Acidipropionibacterium jensenii TaxID=1749 RepID=A0A3T0RWV8_9ACTN|nr:energy-coupling factor ABC transporter substrate-binding protein [Acidipropionibacterium jensenii]AZZ38464.1 energy-coupling factor ABC transporter substrate-binding protein [Acidipropionibacterium jensenii]MDN5977921.1 energy-coupling factor ABC transporter substrate-binding protein [Acidipropionibacterium jensenii]MDN5996898.1 energy-coupling factor ABC transporter substrate-binding protein [Acidipropionibacterium jensenii]MDN6020763.1 energy-coupling factor ABC transporter substrate-bindi